MGATCFQIGLRGHRITPWRGRIHSAFVHKKVKHWIAAILKQKMRQNVHQIVFQFPFFRTPATGGSAPDAQGGEAGERRKMREGKGQGERKGGGGKGEEGGREGGSLHHCHWGIDAPGALHLSSKQGLGAGVSINTGLHLQYGPEQNCIVI